MWLYLFLLRRRRWSVVAASAAWLAGTLAGQSGRRRPSSGLRHRPGHWGAAFIIGHGHRARSSSMDADTGQQWRPRPPPRLGPSAADGAAPVAAAAPARSLPCGWRASPPQGHLGCDCNAS